jgi:hypothetical protein
VIFTAQRNFIDSAEFLGRAEEHSQAPVKSIAFSGATANEVKILDIADTAWFSLRVQAIQVE